MKLAQKLAFLGIIVFTLTAGAAAQQKTLKVYISVDMEGIGGVVTGEQLGPSGFEYQRFREFMTAEALAAVNAAKEAGATEILVSDAHGNGQNLLIEKFPPEVRIIRAWPRRFSMMAGIDASFDAVIFLGYHTSAANPAGVRAHTFSSATLTNVKLNGRSVTEAEWNAAIAGHFGVPVVMISGDDQVIAEARRALGPIEGAEVKRALGFHSASTLTPQGAQTLIAEKVKAALARRAEFKPYTVSEPVRVEVSFKHYRAAEALAYLPGVERLDAHTIRYTAKTMLEASDFMVFLTNYNPALEP
jgi:D-amino peptidase